MEQAVLAFDLDQAEKIGSEPKYSGVWAAAGNALALFPHDPRAEKWHWQMAYYLALSGEGEQAMDSYIALIDHALNDQHLKPQDLPTWFQSGNSQQWYLTPNYSLQIDPIQLPGYDAGYMILIGALDNFDIPGPTCLVITKKGDRYKTYPVYNGFSGFIIPNRSVITYSKKDLTGDGVEDIVANYFFGMHNGFVIISVIDISTLPPKELPFFPSKDTGLSFWNAYQIDGQPDDQQIQINRSLSCEESGIDTYHWNGEWFDLVQGEWAADNLTRFSGNEVHNCLAGIQDYARTLPFTDAISIMDSAFTHNVPYLHENRDMFEEFRVMKGIFTAFSGDFKAARSVFREIVDTPTIQNGVWVKPSENFLDVYKEPANLYRACSTVNVCVSYPSTDPSGTSPQKCINVMPCDETTALQATFDTAFATSALAQITEKLKSAGVQVLNEGWHDFDGDSQDELWFTVKEPGASKFELWIGVQAPQGTKIVLAGEISGANPSIKALSKDPSKTLVISGSDQMSMQVRNLHAEEPFIDLQKYSATDLTQQNPKPFYDLRRALYEGEPAAQIYESLSKLDANPPKCPFEWKNSDGTISGESDCASFYFTLAFAAELLGKESEAVQRYYTVWSHYPDSDLAPLARLKLLP
jgi:hypothetical protein